LKVGFVLSSRETPRDDNNGNNGININNSSSTLENSGKEGNVDAALAEFASSFASSGNPDKQPEPTSTPPVPPPQLRHPRHQRVRQPPPCTDGRSSFESSWRGLALDLQTGPLASSSMSVNITSHLEQTEEAASGVGQG
jgi:hypothetical protein